MSTVWMDVEKFNRACGVKIRRTPGWPKEGMALAVDLVAEELRELSRSLTDGDLVETADAIADSLYVLAGLALRLGIDRSTLGFTQLTDHAPIAAQDPAWAFTRRNDVAEIALSTVHPSLVRATRQWNLEATEVIVHHAMWQLVDLSASMALPLASIWAEVQRSNMAKVVDGKVVRDPDTGKILKPEGWTPPDIAGVLSSRMWKLAA